MSDLFDEFAASKILIDRSDLETCANCPMQMRLLRLRRRTVGTAANVGQEVHEAISIAIATYIEADGLMSPSDVADSLRRNLEFSRPDVQPAVIDAARAAVWRIANIIGTKNANAILRYDGGADERSGQIAWDINDDIRLTLELDLLLATESDEVLRIVDWKSGFGTYDIADVATSFQFTKGAVITFQNYPGVQRVDVVVMNTRLGNETPPVHFHRSRIEQYIARLTAAVNAWTDNEEPKPLEQVAAWPSVEKCRLCDAKFDCQFAERETKAPAADVLKRLIVLKAQQDECEELLKAEVVRTGAPVVTEAGDCYGKFGAEKPRETFKVKAAKGEC